MHETPYWVVFHVRGPFGPGALAVVPRRHVTGVPDLTDGEAGGLGALLRAAAGVVRTLTDPASRIS